MTPAVTGESVRSPRGWLGLAFVGVFLYAASKLMEFYPAQASRMTGLSQAALGTYLPLAAIAGTILFFTGLVAALWRANRAAGRTAAAGVGAALGALGVLVLLGESVALAVAQLALSVPIPSLWANSIAVEDFAGTFLAFVGLAGLGLGLAHASGLFMARRAVIGPYRGSYERTTESRY